MGARTDHVTAAMDLRGVSVRVLDYRWNAGEQISEYEHDFILRYRTFPAEISLAARLGGDAVQSFGQLMFFPADVEIRTVAADVPQRTRNIMCRFAPEWFREVWSGASSWTTNDLARCLDMRNLRIEQAVQRLGSEITSPGFASTLLTESLAGVIAVEIARHFDGGPTPLRVRTREGRLSQTDLGRIHDYIESAANRCPSIDDIAGQCDISAAHLRRAFKKTTGRTVHEHVEDVRLRKAKDLLAGTDLPLKEISYRLGFADSSTFSSTFRKVAGETPSGYRHRSRQ